MKTDNFKRVMPRLILSILFLILWPGLLQAQAKRVVVLKIDGMQGDLLDRYVHQKDPKTGKSILPWFEHVFYQRGTRFANFYVRGMSLSAPSWSLLDTGQHLQIKGNVEYDRISLHPYDYLNFLPFYVNYALSRRVDMPGAEVLDEIRVPLLVDAFKYQDRYLGFQLYQRGNHWTTMSRGLIDRVTKPPREMVDEWTVGLETRDIILVRTEKELIEKLNDPRVEYLDYYTTEFDHSGHHNRDVASHINALKVLDETLGRVWTAIERSPLADQTVLFVVSDHGFNSDPNIYSQGYNLVKLLGSTEGGGHHIITKRRLMMDYAVKGIYPLVPLITTASDNSFYLKGQGNKYPTVLLDFDGNERASIHLRDPDLNMLQLLLQQLQLKRLPAPVRTAATNEFFRILESKRPGWELLSRDLNLELGALERWIQAQQSIIAAQPKKWTKEDQDAGIDQDARRVFARTDSAMSDLRSYRAYVAQLKTLLGLKPESFDPRRVKIEDLIPPRVMGERNTVYDLQNYAVGLSPAGLTLRADGSLDPVKSFQRVDYFDLLYRQSVRNNVQAGISNRPVDFVAVRIPREQIVGALPAEMRPDGDVIWVYGGADKQTLLVTRRSSNGDLLVRYQPISGLRQSFDGSFQFQLAKWDAGFPLRIFEDPALALPPEQRAQWLSGWHSDVEWLRAIHKTHYSNGLIGLHEQLTRHPVPALDVDQPGLSDDERLMRRFRMWQRYQTESDLLILANDHWNFDVRGFNPGGNHGSFFRVSTNASLLLAGGANTGVPRGLVVNEPYDSLTFVPTVLSIMGRLENSQRPVPALSELGFTRFPGRVAREVIAPPVPASTSTGASH